MRHATSLAMRSQTKTLHLDLHSSNSTVCLECLQVLGVPVTFEQSSWPDEASLLAEPHKPELDRPRERPRIMLLAPFLALITPALHNSFAWLAPRMPDYFNRLFNYVSLNLDSTHAASLL
mmetsp:Transcript_74224/g.131335  ORF Transcript_74224/g.131335 Transcript_74224/m.131335 type:complete len:120 (-) Transcript_74224:183-542(-)